MRRRLTLLLLLSLGLWGLTSHVQAATWSEPTFTPDIMTAPLPPPPVTGTTFYVDFNSIGGTCNNANAGTVITAPWCTMQKALTTLTAGQRAYVRQGTYALGNMTPTNNGTAGNYITFQGYPGDAKPLIDCLNQTFCINHTVGNERSYIVWNGFEFYRPNQQYLVCSTDTCHHLWFVNNIFRNNGVNFEGLEIGGANIIVSNNEMYNTGKQVVGGRSNETGHHLILEFNHVHDTSFNHDDSGGLKCGDVGPYACIMRYNHVHNNHRDPASNQPCFNINACQGVSGLYIDQSSQATSEEPSYIYNNIVHDNDIGIQAWDGKHIHIFNNIVYNNGFGPGTFQTHFGFGITIDHKNTADVHVYNNTVFGNRNVGLHYGDDASTIGDGPVVGITSRNNIAMNNGGAELFSVNNGIANGNLNNDLLADSGGGTIIHWNGTNYTSLSAFLARGGNTTELNAVSTAATFVNSATGNFHLQAGSAGLNVGATIAEFNYDLDNLTRSVPWDMGAYELAAAGPIVTLTAISPVASGVQPLLTYSQTGATSCTASILSGQADATWTGRTSVNLMAGATNQAQGARTSLTTYRLSCTDGTTAVTADATVSVIPAISTGMTLTVASPLSVARLNTSWAANSPIDLASYNLYFCTTGGSCTPNLLYGNVGNVTSLIMRGLLGNTNYRVCVKPVNTSGNEQPTCSNIPTGVTTEVIPAGAPELLVDFEAGAGTAIFDNSGHGHNSSSYTGTFSALIPTGGGSFSGSFNGAQTGRIPRDCGNAALCAGPTGLEPTTVTIAAWVRRNGTQPSYAGLARKTWQNNGSPTFVSYNLNVNPGGAGTGIVGCQVGFSGGAGSNTIQSTVAVLADVTWTHVACVYEPGGTTPRQRLYISGAPVSVTGNPDLTTPLTYQLDATGDVWLASNSNGGEFFTGQLDEVRIYPRALSPAEIQTLAGVGDTTPPAAPTNLRVVP